MPQARDILARLVDNSADVVAEVYELFVDLDYQAFEHPPFAVNQKPALLFPFRSRFLFANQSKGIHDKQTSHYREPGLQIGIFKNFKPGGHVANAI